MVLCCRCGREWVRRRCLSGLAGVLHTCSSQGFPNWERAVSRKSRINSGVKGQLVHEVQSSSPLSSFLPHVESLLWAWRLLRLSVNHERDVQHLFAPNEMFFPCPLMYAKPLFSNNLCRPERLKMRAHPYYRVYLVLGVCYATTSAATASTFTLVRSRTTEHASKLHKRTGIRSPFSPTCKGHPSICMILNDGLAKSVRMSSKLGVQ